MNLEIKIVLHALLQPELARYGSCSNENIECSTIKRSLIRLATGTANEADIIDDLINDKVIQIDEFISAVAEIPRIGQVQYRELYHELKREKFIALVRKQEKESSPHSHTMAEAVIAAHNDVVRRAKANGDKNAPNLIKVEK